MTNYETSKLDYLILVVGAIFVLAFINFFVLVPTSSEESMFGAWQGDWKCLNWDYVIVKNTPLCAEKSMCETEIKVGCIERVWVETR